MTPKDLPTTSLKNQQGFSVRLFAFDFDSSPQVKGNTHVVSMLTHWIMTDKSNDAIYASRTTISPSEWPPLPGLAFVISPAKSKWKDLVAAVNIFSVRGRAGTWKISISRVARKNGHWLFADALMPIDIIVFPPGFICVYQDKNYKTKNTQPQKIGLVGGRTAFVIPWEHTGETIDFEVCKSPPSWPPMIAIGTAVAVIATLLFTIVRGTSLPMDLAVVVRALLALAVATLLYCLPGQISLASSKLPGIALRAIGAPAAFALVYLFSPDLSLGSLPRPPAFSDIKLSTDPIQPPSVPPGESKQGELQNQTFQIFNDLRTELQTSAQNATVMEVNHDFVRSISAFSASLELENGQGLNLNDKYRLGKGYAFLLNGKREIIRQIPFAVHVGGHDAKNKTNENTLSVAEAPAKSTLYIMVPIIDRADKAAPDPREILVKLKVTEK